VGSVPGKNGNSSAKFSQIYSIFSSKIANSEAVDSLIVTEYYSADFNTTCSWIRKKPIHKPLSRNFKWAMKMMGTA
jgi:hypothetical protein